MPSEAETINEFIRSYASDLHTSIPARVVSFNAKNQTVDVVPAIDKKLSDGEVKKRSTLRNVPVHFIGSTSTIVAFPVKAGSCGILIFQECSTDEWVTGTQGTSANSVAQDRRMHSSTDAVFIPGIWPYAQARSAKAANCNLNEDLAIAHNLDGTQCTVVLKANGDIIATRSGASFALTNNLLTVNCNLQVNGTITATGTVTAPQAVINSIPFTTHKHDGVTVGAGSTGNPHA